MKTQWGVWEEGEREAAQQISWSCEQAMHVLVPLGFAYVPLTSILSTHGPCTLLDCTGASGQVNNTFCMLFCLYSWKHEASSYTLPFAIIIEDVEVMCLSKTSWASMCHYSHFQMRLWDTPRLGFWLRSIVIGAEMHRNGTLCFCVAL